MDKAAKIKSAYIIHRMEKGDNPVSIFSFTKRLKITESDFYAHFNSFQSLEKEIWLDFFSHTMGRLETDEIYNSYSIREKLLAFYYTLIEVLTEKRSYILLSWEGLDRKKLQTPYFLTNFKAAFKTYSASLITLGKEENEVKNRKYLDEYYPDFFYLLLLFIVDIWVKDDSKSFEYTDTMIEKLVNTSFDLMGDPAFDSIIDLLKFFLLAKK